MTKLPFSEATRRDFANIREAWNELLRDMRSPLFWLSLAVVVFFLAAPWLLD